MTPCTHWKQVMVVVIVKVSDSDDGDAGWWVVIGVEG